MRMVPGVHVRFPKEIRGMRLISTLEREVGDRFLLDFRAFLGGLVGCYFWCVYEIPQGRAVNALEGVLGDILPLDFHGFLRFFALLGVGGKLGVWRFWGRA